MIECNTVIFHVEMFFNEWNQKSSVALALYFQRAYLGLVKPSQTKIRSSKVQYNAEMHANETQAKLITRMCRPNYYKVAIWTWEICKQLFSATKILSPRNSSRKKDWMKNLQRRTWKWGLTVLFPCNRNMFVLCGFYLCIPVLCVTKKYLN